LLASSANPPSSKSHLPLPRSLRRRSRQHLPGQERDRGIPPHKDPIQVFQARLIAEGVLSEAEAEEIDAEAARTEADDRRRIRRGQPLPDADDIQKDVYWEADHPAERKSQGRLFFD
jgi:hypothetical protein